MLTDFECRAAKPQTKPYKIFDEDGLYLEVQPNGRKWWRQKYYIFGKEKRISQGVYPRVSLLEARQRCDLAKADIEKGLDPSIVKQQKKRLAKFAAAQTFELVAREWHKEYYDTWSRNHADNLIFILKRYVFPYIGKCPIGELTPPQVLACVQKIEALKRHEVARRTMQIIGQVLKYATGSGRAKGNFVPDLHGLLKRYKKGHYSSITIDELPTFLKTLHESSEKLFPQTVLAIRFMLLTFVRTNELINADWKEFNLDKAVWLIPAERMKMREEHIVPLSRQAVSILKELQIMFGDKGWVFPSVFRIGNPMSNGAILMALRRIGYHKRMTGHGFRSLAMSTIKEKLKYRHEVVDRQLAHGHRNKVDKAYDRAKFLDDRTIMMQEWADYIDNCVRGVNAKTNAA